jgi:hypothetical protein
MKSRRENSKMNHDDNKEDVAFPVLWIRIRMFSGLLDPDPDTLVRGMVYGSGSFSLQKVISKKIVLLVLEGQ